MIRSPHDGAHLVAPQAQSMCRYGQIGIESVGWGESVEIAIGFSGL